MVIANQENIQLVYVNPAMGKMLGYTAEEMTSFQPEDVRKLIHPDDAQFFFGNYKNRLEGKGAPDYYEFRGVKKDGSEIWCGISSRQIIYNGSTTKIL